MCSGAWLLELNCPPCLGAYQGPMEAALEGNPMEAAIKPLVSSMMKDLIGNFVVPPIATARQRPDLIPAWSDNFVEMASWGDESKFSNEPKDLALNGLNWIAHKWKLKKAAKNAK